MARPLAARPLVLAAFAHAHTASSRRLADAPLALSAWKQRLIAPNRSSPGGFRTWETPAASRPLPQVEQQGPVFLDEKVAQVLSDEQGGFAAAAVCALLFSPSRKPPAARNSGNAPNSLHAPGVGAEGPTGLLGRGRAIGENGV